MEGSQNWRTSPSTTRNLSFPHQYDNITASSDLDARNRSRTSWVSSASLLQERYRLSEKPHVGAAAYSAVDEI